MIMLPHLQSLTMAETTIMPLVFNLHENECRAHIAVSLDMSSQIVMKLLDIQLDGELEAKEEVEEVEEPVEGDLPLVKPKEKQHMLLRQKQAHPRPWQKLFKAQCLVLPLSKFSAYLA